jgi:hypothetical protein
MVDLKKIKINIRSADPCLGDSYPGFHLAVPSPDYFRCVCVLCTYVHVLTERNT